MDPSDIRIELWALGGELGSGLVDDFMRHAGQLLLWLADLLPDVTVRELAEALRETKGGP